MKLVSWNVNGLRACVKKGFLDYFKEVDADIFCIQETKLQAGQITLELEGYHQYWNYALKKGYSGTAVFSKKEPLSVRYGVGTAESEDEGRILTLEFDDFFLVNVYTPNSQRDLARLPYRIEWEEQIFSYLKELDAQKPVILCGDLNVAHQEIDLKNPKSNQGNRSTRRKVCNARTGVNMRQRYQPADQITFDPVAPIVGPSPREQPRESSSSRQRATKGLMMSFAVEYSPCSTQNPPFPEGLGWETAHHG